jgi:Tfp pilus assembly protein PilV
MVRSESGFTILEVVIAVLLLSVGVLGMARSSADMTGILSRGDRAITASMYAQERLERLRVVGCDAMTDGNETRGGAYALYWRVIAPTDLEVRRIRLITTYPTGRGTRADTVETSVSCV